MSEKSDRDDDNVGSNGNSEGKEMGRRETLRLATLAAALGAGLSVSFHTDVASAEGAQQLQLKVYRQAKGESILVFATTLPEQASKQLLDAPGLVQLKCFGKEAQLGASQMQLKLEQAKQPAPPPATPGGWDVSKNKKM